MFQKESARVRDGIHNLIGGLRPGGRYWSVTKREAKNSLPYERAQVKEVELGGKLSGGLDPITLYFAGQGLLDQPTFLRPGHYSPLFLEQGDFSSQSLPHRPIYTYRNDKQMWSITPAPKNSQGVGVLMWGSFKGTGCRQFLGDST
ncbi:hypothetical protein B0H14DRAFT_2625510 [Mycena olivaceomarginata]|nr:hypothetical protein B0H14DRAFT_2625510 [Mycena olivaceomarginata]